MSLLVLFIIVGAVALGLLMLLLGGRGRRIDDQPWCRQCRYNLSGHDLHTKCPECGADLNTTRAIGTGYRRKRPLLIVFGSLLLAIALTGGGFVASQLDWMSIKPFWVLKLELEHGSSLRSEAAAGQIVRRAFGGTLTRSQQVEAFDIALSLQADANRLWNPVLGDLLQWAWGAQLLDETQSEAFLRGAFEEGLTLQTKPVARAGAILPVRLVPPFYRVSLGAGPDPVFMATIGVQEVRISDAKTAWHWHAMRHLMFPRGGVQPAFASVFIPADLPPGEYEIVAHCLVGVMENDSQLQEGPHTAMPPWDNQLLTWTETHTTTVRIVGTNEFELVADEALAEQIRMSLDIHEIRLRVHPRIGVFSTDMVSVSAAPIDLAFSVHLLPRDGEMTGTEIQTGSGAAVAAGQSGNIPIGQDFKSLPSDATAVDVILRTNIEAAEREITVLGPVWDGEIVIENVPVVWENGDL